MNEEMGVRTECPSCGSQDWSRKEGLRICCYCGRVVDDGQNIGDEEKVLLIEAELALREIRVYDAEKRFDAVLERFPKNHRAYWGRALAKHGIKYEYDAIKKINLPTCFAPLKTAFTDDPDYKKAVNFADGETRRYYIGEGGKIESIRKEWSEKASKEPSYDIFLCFKDSDAELGVERTEDSYAVQELYTHLLSKGYRVFYSRESLRGKTSERYEPYVYHALDTAKIMIVYATEERYLTSTWVRNEWQRFCAQIAAGKKRQDSLFVAYGKIDASRLERLFGRRQFYDAVKKTRTFFLDLDAYIERITAQSDPGSGLEKKTVIRRLLGDTARRRAVTTKAVGSTATETTENEGALLDIGYSMLEMGRFEKAKQNFRRVLKTSPGNASALMGLQYVDYGVRGQEEFVAKLVADGDITDDIAVMTELIDNAPERDALKIYRTYAEIALARIKGSRGVGAQNAELLAALMRYDTAEKKDLTSKVIAFALDNGNAEVLRAATENLDDEDAAEFLPDIKRELRAMRESDEEKTASAAFVLGRALTDVFGDDGEICAYDVEYRVARGGTDGSALILDAEKALSFTKNDEELFGVLSKWLKVSADAVKTARSRAEAALRSAVFLGLARFIPEGYEEEEGGIVHAFASALLSGGFYEIAAEYADILKAYKGREEAAAATALLVRCGQSSLSRIIYYPEPLENLPEFQRLLESCPDSARRKAYAKLIIEQEEEKKRLKDEEEQKERERRERQRKKREQTVSEVKKKLRQHGGSIITWLCVIIFLALPASATYLLIKLAQATESIRWDLAALIIVPTLVLMKLARNSFRRRRRYSVRKRVILIVVIIAATLAVGLAADGMIYDERTLSVSRNADEVKKGRYEKFCNIEIVTLSDSVEKIGKKAFGECTGLEYFNISAGSKLTTIGDEAFFACTELQSITLPATLTEIGDSAFANCGKLKSFRFRGSKEEWAAVEKGKRWSDGIAATYVSCSDGVVYFT